MDAPDNTNQQDDLTIMSRDINLINNLKGEHSRRFKMKDLGDIHYILKMEVRRDRARRAMTISQRQYTNNLIEKFGITESKPVSTPQLVGEL
jgi:hypothetical protein